MTSRGPVRIESPDAARFAAALAGASRTLKRRMTARLQSVATPIGREVRDLGAAPMPRRGGLQRRLRSARVSSRVVWAKDAAVEIHLTAAGANIPLENTGVVSHPVFGRRDRVRQPVPAGTWSRALDAQRARLEAAVHKEVEAIVDDVARKSN